jgi:hypothetical protein
VLGVSGSITVTEPKIGLYIGEGTAAEGHGVLPAGARCTIIVYLRHEQAEELDFSRATEAARMSGWAWAEFEEAAFRGSDAEPSPGFEEQLQRAYEGAVEDGFHVLFFRGE